MEIRIHHHLQLLLRHIDICRVLGKQFNGNRAISSVLRNFLQDLYILLSLLMIINFHVIRLIRISSLVTLSDLENVMDVEEIILLPASLLRRNMLAISNFTGIFTVTSRRYSSK